MRLSIAAEAAVAVTALFAANAMAQDVVRAAPASNKVRLENADVRVIESAIKPGEREGMHTHPAGWYYVTEGGTLRVEFADGKKETWAPKTGESGWLDAEGPHVSENTGKTTLRWTLVEVKSAASRTR